jgi:hypothetical protein
MGSLRKDGMERYRILGMDARGGRSVKLGYAGGMKLEAMIGLLAGG